MTKPIMHKRLTAARAALCLLPLLCLPSRADLIKQSSTYQRTVLMTDSTDHVTGKAGLTLSITLSKAGAAYAGASPTVTELGNGIYSIALANGNTGTLGALDMHISASGADPTDTHDQVIPADFSDLLAARQAIVLATGTVGASPTTTVIPTGLNTTAGDIYSGDELTWLTGPNAGKASHVASWSSTGSALTLAAALPNTPTAGDTFSLSPYGKGLVLLTTGGINTSGQVLVGGYATGQDPATLLFSASYLTIPGDHTVSGTQVVLTYKQWMALQDAIGAAGGDNTSTVPVKSGTASVTYYLRGAAKISSNVVAVGTVTYDSSGNQVSRSVKVMQPFPSF